MNNPEISIAMCTYNGSAFIVEQLQSIFSQTIPPAEIVIYDDCSQDDTVDVIEDFIKDSEIPVYLHVNKTNLGFSKNFFQAIKKCTCEYIALADQDDIWYPNKLEVLVNELLKSSEKKLVFSNVEIVNSNNELMNGTHWELLNFNEHEIKHFNSGNELGVLLKRNVISGMSMMFHQSLVSDETDFHSLWDGYHFDGFLGIKSALQESSVAINSTLVRYRQHGANFIGVLPPKSMIGFLFNRVESSAQYLKNIEHNKLLLDYISNQSFDPQLCIDKKCQLVQQKINFYEARLSYPRFIFFRLLFVLYRFIIGDYHRFSFQSPWKSMLKDILIRYI
ncbi:hypothetical protein DID73_00885 [Candidatus Marinamargulisbacteria bacterium SCGC AG-343-K17]|nr:hypothetical protein DID73_00885 [Candidatus Marinamargulisbacteria bacterium SCGC AG-343-K17]